MERAPPIDRTTRLVHLIAASAMTAAAVVAAEAGAANRAAAGRGAPPSNTAAPATAAPAPGMPGGPPLAAEIAAADRSFVTTAASTGVLEVEASRLAVERSRHPQVRAFAQRMIDDHRRAHEELTDLAKDAGVADVPGTTMGKYAGMLEKLRSLKDAAFDREYAAQIGVAGHTEAVARFEQAARQANHAALKAFAARQLPALREHLQQAEGLARAVGVSDARMKEATEPPDLATGSGRGAGATTGSQPAPARPSSGR